MKPIVYYDNLLHSGVVSGTFQSTDNPVRKVSDGSINLPYHMGDSSIGSFSGSIFLVLTSAQLPTTLILPKCSIPSGIDIELLGMDDVTGTNTVIGHIGTFDSQTEFFLTDLLSGATAKLVWELRMYGLSGLDPLLHEVQLAVTKYQVARPAQLVVDRTRIRQFTRIPVAGGQPFVKRDGPLLRQTTYTFILVSGAAEIDPARAFVGAVEGGEAFTLTDDLGDSYWAELIGNEIAESDSGGVSTLNFTYQEIKVD